MSVSQRLTTMATVYQRRGWALTRPLMVDFLLTRNLVGSTEEAIAEVEKFVESPFYTSLIETDIAGSTGDYMNDSN